MSKEQEVIIFKTEDGEEISFQVIEQTTINAVNYLLVAEDSDEEEAEAMILKEVSEEDGTVIYDAVEKDEELKAISKVFGELLEDIEIES